MPLGFARAPTVFALALVILASAPGHFGSGQHLAVHLAMTALVASIVLRPSSAIVKILEWRPVAFIGAVSYGMYLYHLVLIERVDALVLHLALLAFPSAFLISLALTVITAAISFYLVEQPFFGLGKSFGERRS